MKYQTLLHLSMWACRSFEPLVFARFVSLRMLGGLMVREVGTFFGHRHWYDMSLFKMETRSRFEIFRRCHFKSLETRWFPKCSWLGNCFGHRCCCMYASSEAWRLVDASCGSKLCWAPVMARHCFKLTLHIITCPLIVVVLDLA